MKKIISAFASTLIFAITSVHTNAQKVNAMRGTEFKNEIAYVPVAKALPETKETHNVLYKVSIKAVRHFMTTYPHISNEKWEILKDGYMASFVSNSIFERVYFDKKGNWLHSITQYDETKLPTDVRASVKSIYYDYAITTADEINISGKKAKPIYLVHITFNNTFKTIRVCDGEVGEIKL